MLTLGTIQTGQERTTSCKRKDKFPYRPETRASTPKATVSFPMYTPSGKMGDANRRKTRAVRLTDDGLALLQKRLNEEWHELELEGRMTRSARATMMSVSVVTAERILQRKGNDRAVLQEAFKSVGLEWNDRFCEPMRGKPEDPSTPPDSVGAPGPAFEISRPAIVTRRVVPIAVASAALSTLLMAWLITLGIVQRTPEPPKRDWSKLARNLSLEAGRQAYHRGELAKAKSFLAHSAQSAIMERDTEVLAEARRLEGEILAAEGDLEGALAKYNEALPIRASFKAHWGHASLLEALAITESRLGHFEKAERHLLESIEGLRRWDDYRGAAASMRSLGVVLADQRRFDEAWQWLEAALNEMKHNPDPGLLSDIKAQKAMIMVERGDALRAKETLLECRAEWESRGHRGYVAATLVQIAKADRALGNREEALRKLKEAKRTYAQVDDTVGVKTCERLLAEW